MKCSIVGVLIGIVMILTVFAIIGSSIQTQGEKNEILKQTTSVIRSYEHCIDVNENEATFVIIAPEVFYEYDGVWNLQRLADWHNENDILTAYVVNLSEIYTNVTFWVNGTWGDANQNNPFKRNDEQPITQYSLFNDSQAQIRNYLRYAYTQKNVRYALLVGDADDSNPLFPIRECFSKAEGAPLLTPTIEYELIPTDMYYACLNGTFNADEDRNSKSDRSGFGEKAIESDAHIDECDWEYEIAVGRFPVDNITELIHLIQKTISYMSISADDEYLQNVTLAGQGGGFGGITQWMANYSKTLKDATYTDWKDRATTYGFTADTWRIKILDANPNREEGEPFYTANSRGTFNNGVHIFYESSHGSPYGWAAVGGEADGFTTSDIKKLTNSKYCFVLSAMPCNTATFDLTADCFGEVFVTDEHGAFAYLGNTRYGFGSYGGDGLNSSSHRLGAEILDAFLNTSEGYLRIGDMVFDAKQDVRHWQDDLDDKSIRYAMYEQILFGSPAVTLHHYKENQAPMAPTIDGQTNGKTGTTYYYSLTTHDPEQDHVKYEIDWGDNTSTITIYYTSGEEIMVSHTWHAEGTYNVRVKALDEHNAESDWITLTVTMPCSYNNLTPHFVELLFQRFPYRFSFLRQLMGY